ncbi:MAG TPA: 16S rRNA (cytosine(1402)-N(4))-methyltransferase RsmH [Candidatus Paceibacterota bacterium]
MAQDKHTPVLLQETIELLDSKKGDTVLDATVGAGGHSLEIANRIGASGALIGLDQDQSALDASLDKLGKAGPRIILLRENFRNLDKALESLGIKEVDRIIFDLGMSSMDIESSGRGFSFNRDEPLLMTLSSEVTPETLTAKDVVNSWGEESLADIIYGFGGEQFSRRIAKAIVEERERGPIENTLKLAEIVTSAVPDWYRKRKLHPATKTFQAIRIAVNDELGALKEGIDKGWASLKKGGRMAVISFHELEDRIVKNKFKEYGKNFEAKIITKKPVVPQREEVLENPRSRSAKLRAIEK